MATAGKSSVGGMHPGDSKPKGDQKDLGSTRLDGRRLTQTTTQDLASSTGMYQSAGGAPPSAQQLQRIQESQQVLQQRLSSAGMGAPQRQRPVSGVPLRP